VRLGPGLFREGGIRVPFGGTPARPVLIEGAGENLTVLRGSVVVDAWVPHAPGIWRREGWTTNSQQVFCDGLHLQQIGARSSWHDKMLWDNQATLPPVGRGLADLRPGSFFHDGATETLYVMLADRSDPNRRLMEASEHPFVLHGNEQVHVTLRHLTLGHSNGTHDGGKGMVIELGAAHWTLENCTIEYGDFACVVVRGREHLIRKCQIRHGGSLGLEMTNSDAAHAWAFYDSAPRQNTLIEACSFSDHNYRGFDTSWHAGGMKLIPAVRGVTVRGNHFTRVKGPAIWFDHPLGENVIEGNLVQDADVGIFYELAATYPSVEYTGIITRNTIVNSRQQGIYVSASSGVEVSNNTVVGCWAGIVMHGMPRGEFQLRDNRIHGNIILGGARADMILYVGPGSGENRVNGNFFATGVEWPPATEPRQGIRVGVVEDKGYRVNYFSVETLAGATPYEHEGSSGDPAWVDPRTLDFRLRPDSPARGKGAWNESSP
jgi:parallel beta-helix repeat protein